MYINTSVRKFENGYIHAELMSNKNCHRVGITINMNDNTIDINTQDEDVLPTMADISIGLYYTMTYPPKENDSTSFKLECIPTCKGFSEVSTVSYANGFYSCKVYSSNKRIECMFIVDLNNNSAIYTIKDSEMPCYDIIEQVIPLTLAGFNFGFRNHKKL